MKAHYERSPSETSAWSKVRSPRTVLILKLSDKCDESIIREEKRQLRKTIARGGQRGYLCGRRGERCERRARAGGGGGGGETQTHPVKIES